MKYILFISLLFFAGNSHAQFWKDKFKQAKEKLKEKAEQKLDEKLNNGTNSAVEKADSMISGKRRDPKAGKSNSGNETVESAPDNTPADNNQSGGEIEKNYKEVTIKTNIRCETGKKKLEAILRNTDGVSSAMIDNDNGNLYLSSENTEVHNKVIELIRQNGFEADGKKPTNPIANPCK